MVLVEENEEKLKRIASAKLKTFIELTGRTPNDSEREKIAEEAMGEIMKEQTSPIIENKSDKEKLIEKKFEMMRRQALKQNENEIQKPVEIKVADKKNEPAKVKKDNYVPVKVDKKDNYVPRRYRRFIRPAVKDIPKNSGEYNEAVEDIYKQLNEAEKQGIHLNKDQVAPRSHHGFRDDKNEMFEGLIEKPEHGHKKIAFEKVKEFQEEKGRKPTKEELDQIADDIYWQTKGLPPEEKAKAETRPEVRKEKEAFKQEIHSFLEENSTNNSMSSADLFGESGKDDLKLFDDSSPEDKMFSLDDDSSNKNICPNCLNESKYIIYCSKCGEPFCEHCGKDKKEVAGKLKIKCPKCLTENTKNK